MKEIRIGTSFRARQVSMKTVTESKEVTEYTKITS